MSLATGYFDSCIAELAELKMKIRMQNRDPDDDRYVEWIEGIIDAAMAVMRVGR